MRQMGGLGKLMPATRNCFIIGAVALAGLPILNGFWSKELVLEAGLTNGPLWAYLMMVLGAGLTALYTLRCVWLVFFGEPRSAIHAHDAGKAMRTALYPLAFGTLTSWLLAGPFALLLSSTLPLHFPEGAGLKVETTWGILKEVLVAPATYAVLAVIALGLAAWTWRKHLTGITNSLRGIGRIAANSFGFEAINHAVVNFTMGSSEELRDTQTGQLSWNLVAILAALIYILAVLAIGL
jgi:NADH-quinone oxidoreductase subunit L